MPDIVVVGGGPAGVSAALTARNRGKTVSLIFGGIEDIPLYKSMAVDNYPGMAHVSGKDLLLKMHDHAKTAGAEIIKGRVLSVMRAGDGFYVSIGSDFFDCRAVVLASGIVQNSMFPGESKFLGSGVSYCATCDGMLFRNKRVAVIGLTADADDEAEFLRGIGCDVLFFGDSKKYEIKGDQSVTGILADGVEHQVDGVFIFRGSIALDNLVPGISLESGYITVDEKMSTNIRGVFAAGDCTGKPYQIAKAVGQGNLAGLFAAEYIDKG